MASSRYSRRLPLPDHSFSTAESRQPPEQSLSHSSSFSSVDSQPQPPPQQHQPSSSTISSSHHYSSTQHSSPVAIKPCPPLTVMTGSTGGYGRGHSPDLQQQHQQQQYHPTYRPYTPTTPTTPSASITGSLSGHHQGYATPTSPRFDAVTSSYPGGLHPLGKGGRAHHQSGVVPTRRMPSNESHLVYDPYRSRQPGVSANKVKNDYRAQSPVREQLAMQQQQQHPRHGPTGSQRFQAGYGSSSDDGLDNTHQDPMPRQPLQYPAGVQDHAPSSPVLSEHSLNYRSSLQYPHHYQQQQQPSYYYSQGGTATPNPMEDRTDYNRVDPYRSAISQQQHASSSSASSPFLGPQSLMMYHNNNNSTISGHSQPLYDETLSSYDSRLSMLGQHPTRSHQFPQQQQQHLQPQGSFPLVLLDSHRSESEIEDRSAPFGGAHTKAMGHRSQSSKSDSAGTDDRHFKQSGMEDDDDLSDSARRARAAIIAAHHGPSAHLMRNGVPNTGQRSETANTSGTTTQDLIQGESKSSSASSTSGAGVATGTAAASADKGGAKRKHRKRMMSKGSRHDIDSEDELEEGQEKGALRHREPRCCFCLSRRACVYTTFLSLILLAVALFFLVPRMPVVTFDSVRAEDAPVVTHNHIEEPFMMRLRMDSKANWIPLRLNRVDLTLVYKLDQSKIGNNQGLAKELTIPARRVQYFDFAMRLSFTARYPDTNTDGVFQELVRACTPTPPTASEDPLGINIQVLGKLSVWGLAWVWKPEFTLDVSNMPCPINAREPPVEPEEPSTSTHTTSTSTPTSTMSLDGTPTNTSSLRPTSTGTSSARSEPTASSQSSR